jgi:carboxyl-terminal processing protease
MSIQSFAWLFIFFFFAVPVNSHWLLAQDLNQNLQFQQIARTLGELLPKHHVSARPLDDEISKRTFDRFLSELDPNQSTFKASDRDEFANFRMRLDDEIKVGSLQFPDLVYRRLRQRLRESNAALREQELAHENPMDQLVQFLNCITQAYDPHTVYRAPATQANAEIASNLSLQGIGAALVLDQGNVIITSIVAGGAAERDGRIKPGDKIMSIQQHGDVQGISVQGLGIDQVVAMIRGAAGSSVRLVVDRNGTSLSIDLVRAKIRLHEGAAYGEVLQRQRDSNGGIVRIGFIGLPSFYVQESNGQPDDPTMRSASRDVKRLLNRFASESVEVVVLDLSNNDRGSLSEAISCVGLFINHGPVVQLKDSNGEVKIIEDADSGTSWEGPLVVLTSKWSVSASEVFAGAIRCYQRGLIVGDETTHGKGTVQSILDLGEHISSANGNQAYGALKITTKQFYLPDGSSNQREGVRADVVLATAEGATHSIEAELMYALPADQVNAIPFQLGGHIDESLRQELKIRSAARNTNATHSQEAKSNEPSSVNERERFVPNPYLEEVLRVAMDFAELQRVK